MAKEMQIFRSVSPTYVDLKQVNLVCMCVRRVRVCVCVRACLSACLLVRVRMLARQPRTCIYI